MSGPPVHLSDDLTADHLTPRRNVTIIVTADGPDAYCRPRTPHANQRPHPSPVSQIRTDECTRPWGTVP
jgi:hypothetical protein